MSGWEVVIALCPLRAGENAKLKELSLLDEAEIV